MDYIKVGGLFVLQLTFLSNVMKLNMFSISPINSQQICYNDPMKYRIGHYHRTFKIGGGIV